jgi:hypothetical protein
MNASQRWIVFERLKKVESWRDPAGKIVVM